MPIHAPPETLFSKTVFLFILFESNAHSACATLYVMYVCINVRVVCAIYLIAGFFSRHFVEPRAIFSFGPM